MRGRWRTVRNRLAAATVAWTTALAVAAGPAAAQAGPSQQTIEEAVRNATPGPLVVLGVAAVGGFVGALLANAVWSWYGGSSQRAGGAGTGGRPPREPGPSRSGAQQPQQPRQSQQSRQGQDGQQTQSRQREGGGGDQRR